MLKVTLYQKFLKDEGFNLSLALKVEKLIPYESRLLSNISEKIVANVNQIFPVVIEDRELGTQLQSLSRAIMADSILPAECNQCFAK
jgi:hypothetical protein